MRRKTPEEIAWLLENAPLHTHAETLRLFADAFGWAPSKPSLAAWMADKGISPTNSPMRWTAEMDAYFCEVVPGHSETEIAELFEERFGVHLTPAKIGNRKTTLGVRSGTVGGRFEPGHESPTKGKTWDELGLSLEARERSRSTCFKAGSVPVNGAGVPVGSERVTRDGYVEVKVRELSSRPCANDCWKGKHRIVWEEANGRPVPPSSMIVFADRDKSNLDPENLACVPRAVWATVRKLGLAYHDRGSLEASILTARLMQRAHELELSERRCAACGAVFRPKNKNQRRCRACIDAGRKKR